jgi:hypothetical protein
MSTMSNDEFDNIVNGPDGALPADDGDITSLWGAVETAFPYMYDGVLVKGLLLVEVVHSDGNKSLRFQTSDGLSPWDAKGMLRDVLDSFTAESTVEFLMGQDDGGDEE